MAQVVYDQTKTAKAPSQIEKLIEVAGRRVSLERQFGLDVKARKYPLGFVQSGFTNLLANYKQEHEIMLDMLGGDLRDRIEFAADEKLRIQFNGSFEKYKASLQGVIPGQMHDYKQFKK